MKSYFFRNFYRVFILVLINKNENNLTMCWWTDFLIVNQNISVEDNQGTSPANQVFVGSAVNMTCQSTRAYEYCTWRHHDKECKFEWIRVRYI